MVVVEDLLPEVIAIMRPFILDQIVLKSLARKFRDQWIHVLDYEVKHDHDDENSEEEEEEEAEESFIHSEGKPLKYELTGIPKVPKEGEDAICIILYIHHKTITLALINNREDYPPSVVQQHAYNLDKLTAERVSRSLAEFLSILDEEIQEQSLVVGVVGRLPFAAQLCEKLKNSIKNYPALEKLFFTDIPINESTAWLLEKHFRDPDIKATLLIDDEYINFAMLKRIVVRGKDKKDVRKITSAIYVPLSNMENEEILNDVMNACDIEACSSKSRRKHKVAGGRIGLMGFMSGTGLAEVVRVCIVKAIEQAELFNSVATKKIQTPHTLKLKDIFTLEQDPGGNRFQALLEHFGYDDVSERDCVQIQFISRTVVRRTCNVIAACLTGLACIAPKIMPTFVIGGDFLKYPRFKFYFDRAVDLIKPSSLQIDLQFVEGPDEILVGTSVLTASSAAELVQREQGLRSLPPFLLAECCYQEIQKYLNCP